MVLVYHGGKYLSGPRRHDGRADFDRFPASERGSWLWLCLIGLVTFLVCVAMSSVPVEVAPADPSQPIAVVASVGFLP